MAVNFTTWNLTVSLNDHLLVQNVKLYWPKGCCNFYVQTNAKKKIFLQNSVSVSRWQLWKSWNTARHEDSSIICYLRIKMNFFVNSCFSSIWFAFTIVPPFNYVQNVCDKTTNTGIVESTTHNIKLCLKIWRRNFFNSSDWFWIVIFATPEISLIIYNWVIMLENPAFSRTCMERGKNTKCLKCTCTVQLNEKVNPL